MQSLDDLYHGHVMYPGEFVRFPDLFYASLTSCVSVPCISSLGVHFCFKKENELYRHISRYKQIDNYIYIVSANHSKVLRTL